MVNAKILVTADEKMIFREKIIRQMEDQFESVSILYLWGEMGCGKTTAVFQYLKQQQEMKKAYLQLDRNDNQSEQFARGLISIGESLDVFSKGMFATDDLSSLTEVHQIFQKLLEKIQNARKENFCIVFDQIQELANEELKREIQYFLEYLPNYCKIILAGREDLSKELKELYYKGKIAVFSAQDLFFDKSEIREYFYMQKKKISVEQIQDIYRMTGGWPGAVAMLSVWKMHEISKMHKGKEYLYFFVKERLWRRLTNDEKKLLRYAKEVPFFTEDFCKEVFRMQVNKKELFYLENIGIIIYNVSNEQYKISHMMRFWLQEEKIAVQQEELRQIKKRAAFWYQRHNEIREMLEMMEDPREIESVLIENVDQIIKIFTLSEIEKYLSKCEVNSSVEELSFLKGWVAAKENQKEILDQELDFLKKRWKKNADNTEKNLELYMNLLFADSRVNICQWINFLKENWKYEKRMHLFTISGGSPVICCGIKNFAPIFIGTIKEERNYLKIWNTFLDQEAQIAMEISKYDYYIQTERSDKVYGQMQQLQEKMVECDNGELLAGLFYLMFCFQRKKVAYDFETEMQLLLKELKQSRELRVWENCHVLKTFLIGNRGSNDEMGKWLLYESPREREADVKENSYLLSLKAKCYLQMSQYRKAINLCEKLADYFGRMALTQFQVSSILEQAVALFEIGEKKEAIFQVTRAVTLGGKYRYIDLYTFYGETGVRLIEEYQKLTNFKLSEKRTYYYRNVVRANFEGYQSTLLRFVKKARKQALVSRKSNDMKYGKLTMTELIILRYINSGYGNQEIGDAMNIKVSTVKSHIYNIYKKLGVSTRVQAINEAKEKGII